MEKSTPKKKKIFKNKLFKHFPNLIKAGSGTRLDKLSTDFQNLINPESGNRVPEPRVPEPRVPETSLNKTCEKHSFLYKGALLKNGILALGWCWVGGVVVVGGSPRRRS